jgi:hypothetical protein
VDLQEAVPKTMREGRESQGLAEIAIRHRDLESG